MSISFSEKPGTHERHQKRKYNNPLFADADQITADSVEAARQRDELAHQQFMEDFQQLVQDIVSLDSQAESQDILNLKSRLDQAFEASASLPGDLTPIRSAIQKLMAPMMQAIQASAGDDPVAQATLEDEDNARALHYTLLENPLIADLLSKDSPITPEELAATLLSEDPAIIAQAMNLFSPKQQTTLLEEATALLNQLEEKGRSTAFTMEQIAAIKHAAKNAGE